MVAFTDFECPFCARVNPTLDQLRAEYGARVRFVFKHFPLPIHPRAMLAHQAAIAAAAQGKFWEMHDRIFAAQQALDRATLVAHAKALGLDLPKFEHALDDPATQARIRADVDEGTRIGVQGTPTFVVNGRMFSGAQPYESFKAQVEQALGLVQSRRPPQDLATR
ncbi:MAG: DsbA family protein [Gemmatimonadetes bacterium]|nr:DsbA family protein [Gemmatimonadota bacterium]